MNLKNIKKGRLDKGLNKELYGLHEEYNLPIRYKVEEVSTDSGYEKPFIVKSSKGDVIKEFDTEERASTWAKYWNKFNKTRYPE